MRVALAYPGLAECPCHLTSARIRASASAAGHSDDHSAARGCTALEHVGRELMWFVSSSEHVHAMSAVVAERIQPYGIVAGMHDFG